MGYFEIKRITFIIFPMVALLLWLITIPLLLHAKELPEHEVRIAVETWVRYIAAAARPDAIITRMEAYQADGKTVAFIAHIRGGGFCLCGADDVLLPVYLYSPTGSYRVENPNYRYILWEIETRLINLQQGLRDNEPAIQTYQNELNKRSGNWQELISGRVPETLNSANNVSLIPDVVVLPLTSTWHQSWPYNDQCPVLTPPDEHTITGCVATAMSLIMYYWKWPNSGIGDANITYDYRFRTNWDEEPLANDPQIPPKKESWEWDWTPRLQWTLADGGKLRMNGYWDESLYKSAANINADSDYQDALENLWDRLIETSTNHYANFGATTYDWSMMHDIHPAYSGDAEVAKLCHHAGVAVDMNYGIHASGAFSIDIDDALADHFRYDSDANYAGRDAAEIIEDIQWFRPVLFGGHSNTTSDIDVFGHSGHEWVILGYKLMTMEFLMNMGWGDPPEWYTFDEVFPSDQVQITQTAPKDVVKFVGATDEGDGSPDDPYKNIEEALLKAPNNSTLIFKAGSVNSFYASSLVINRPFILKGYNATIQK